VLVAEVQAGSAAELGGLRQGDLLLKFDGEVVANVDDLHRMLTAERAGQACEAEVLRQGRIETFAVTPAVDD
jgi:serine protease Do